MSTNSQREIERASSITWASDQKLFIDLYCITHQFLTPNRGYSAVIAMCLMREPGCLIKFIVDMVSTLEGWCLQGLGVRPKPTVLGLQLIMSVVHFC